MKALMASLKETKMITRVLFLTLTSLSCLSHAGVSQIVGAKIQAIEFYGHQFTVVLDKPHSSKGCGHPGNAVAIDTSKEPGKTQYSALMSAWVASKTVSMRVTDETCSGDRPTLMNWSAY